MGTWLLLTIMILMNSRDRLSKDRGACAQIILNLGTYEIYCSLTRCWFRLEIALIACENSKQSSAALVISQQNASLVFFIYKNRNLLTLLRGLVGPTSLVARGVNLFILVVNRSLNLSYIKSAGTKMAFK